MLISLKWLSEYVPLTLSAEELAHRLTLAGVKVEKIHARGSEWEGIVVGHVLKVYPHPDPQVTRIRMVDVNIGQAEPMTVVCGAPNVAAGQKIAFATIGTKVRDGHDPSKTITLKAANMRGVTSNGMVCSEAELGLSEAHEGILELPDDAPIGQPLGEYLGDVIYDVEVTPNRPDHMSVLGVAWEVAAQTHTKVKEPERIYAEAGTQTAAQRTSVTIQDRDLCPRYLAGVVERIKVGESPDWLKQKLIAAGMRPINNVVDITNFVMLEMGQPLHAFDYRKLGGQKIVVRRAQPGERIRTLDGVDRDLTTEMLVIADDKRPVAVAGVMGGADAEVTSATTTVLLEAANFNAVSVRRTSGALGLRTEASMRFEKGLHPELAAVAARRAMKLLVEVAGGRAAKGLVDTYPTKRADTRVEVTRERIEKVLGLDLRTTQVRQALTDLGFGCRVVPPDRYVVRAPYWRTDINLNDDVVEELARVIGYDRLETQPLGGAIPPPVDDPVANLREQLKDAAVAAGMQEVITYPLTTPEILALVDPPEKLEVHPPLRMENPMSVEQAVMRTSLRHSLLQTLSSNLRHQRGAVAIFESARVYLSKPDDLPEERQLLVGAVAGYRSGRWGEPTAEPIDFFDAKGLLEDTFERTLAPVEFRAGQEYGMLRNRTAELLAGGARVGFLGQVHPNVASAFEVDTPVYMFEIDINRLLPSVTGEVHHKPLSRFPAVIQDIALLVDIAVPAAKVQALIASSNLVGQAQLFDVYEGDRLPDGKRSLAFAVHFQAPDRTLTEKEVADARARIVRRLQHELGAELRGG
ncbi:MAG: phenylalanine--tRNA ligase subunit beta [Dehalococcoidia bacterium]